MGHDSSSKASRTPPDFPPELGSRLAFWYEPPVDVADLRALFAGCRDGIGDVVVVLRDIGNRQAPRPQHLAQQRRRLLSPLERVGVQHAVGDLQRRPNGGYG